MSIFDRPVKHRDHMARLWARLYWRLTLLVLISVSITVLQITKWGA